MPPGERAPTAGALAVLANGEIELRGRMPWSSNATFLVTVSDGDTAMPAVYKPGRGERPLWDFPDGLYLREVAAYRLSEALGWGLVPETVPREDGPLGAGSLQRFVPADFREHYFTLLEEPRHHRPLQAVATFDMVANNADRKSGHCLLGEDDRIWAIDNGLCFKVQANLRTVIWDFAGERIPDELLGGLDDLATGALELSMLDELLAPAEVAAIRKRAAAAVRTATFPSPDHSPRAYPWPLV